MQRIISWNVASIRARWPLLADFLRQEQPDIVFLQEIKTTEEHFPFMEAQIEGYHAIISGQKGYNGVAILSKKSLKNMKYSLKGFEDQARFIQAETEAGTILISVYVPNGNPPVKNPEDTTRLKYKLQWMNALNEHIQYLIKQGKTIIIGGDFNVIERDTDVYNPDLFRCGALMCDSVRQSYAELGKAGLINVVRSFNPLPHTYSFWDFQGGAWRLNHGILLDALWITADLQVTNAQIYQNIRSKVGTSDHVPVGADIKYPLNL
ncbi:MAG: exodeoxyribonuclease III [Pseudomonadota bacterium]|nr:exodeoxyribonuclease III [Pseudomonadota bacterium]